MMQLGRLRRMRWPNFCDAGSDDVPALPPRSESAEFSDGNHDRPLARCLCAPGDRMARTVALGAARRLRRLRGCCVRDDPHAAPAGSARRILRRDLVHTRRASADAAGRGLSVARLTDESHSIGRLLGPPPRFVIGLTCGQLNSYRHRESVDHQASVLRVIRQNAGGDDVVVPTMAATVVPPRRRLAVGRESDVARVSGLRPRDARL